jgi:chromosome segregation protein
MLKLGVGFGNHHGALRNVYNHKRTEMRVERLEVFGFKSFMERLVLPLEAGITGVVGPNGCGKSNIIDALRWVLGESRASQLRGGVLEDVIFNGTESLRPLGLAEVSIVIRADKDNLLDELIEYYEKAEVSVSTAALPASTQEASQAALDAQQDASEQATPSDAPVAVATAGGVLPQEAVNQDSIEAPDAPVAAADDSAEVASHDFLSDIKASLSKYSWLQSISEVQVTRRLYRSGESEFFINKVPCRLKDMKELFRVLGLASRGYTIIAQGEIGRIITAKPDDRRQVIEEAAHIAGFREHINAVSKRLEDTKGQVLRLEDVIKEVARQVAHLKRQATRAATRAELKEELVHAERELFTDTFARLQKRVRDVAERADAFARDEEVAAQALKEVQEQEHHARERSMQFDVEIEEMRQNADRIKENLHKRNREIAQRESRLRELQSVVNSRNSEIARLEERRVVLNSRLNESMQSLRTLEQRAAELEQGVGGLDLSGEEEQRSISSELSVLRDTQRELDRAVREVRDRLVSAQSRRDALQSQMTAASPISQLKRALGGDGALPNEIKGDYKLLVDGIKVPDRYSKALQSVLAERATFLVVDEVSKVARTFQELVLKADPSNKRGLGIGLFAALSDEEIAQVPTRDFEGVSPILAHVEPAQWSKGIVSRLLSNVWVAHDLDTALRFVESEVARGTPDRDTVVVTEAGDLVSPWSFYSLRHDGGVIQIKSKVDEATQSIGENQARYDQVAQERDSILLTISEKERRHAELTRSIHDSQKQLRELSNQQAEVRGRIQSETKMYQQLGNDLERIEPQRAEIESSIRSVQETSAQVQEEIEDLKQRDNSELESELNQISVAMRELEEKRKGLRDEFTQLLRSIDARRRAHESVRDSVVRERMASERIKGELHSTQTSVRERFGEDILKGLLDTAEKAELLAHDLRNQLEQRVTTIRQRLEREGEVDPTVIEQHEAESKRLEDLTVQREDLVKASETLQVTLNELSDACTRRFVQTFEAIRGNFAVFGPKLFGGGSAELRLVDPTNPLESGVEIIVRPPGKKPKSIDLLSGGEKALCAIALVFSMFMVRPSPICVLDEVDAPLDEANVQRFVSFIQEMSSRTQFLVITHNKQTMAAADTLVGVTMPTPGASKILTVSLQEAVKQVA